MIAIEPSGVIFIGECEIQSVDCVARTPAPITAIRGVPGKGQVDVCRPCLEYMVREGQWSIVGARVSPRHDISVYSVTGELLLAVEVKALTARRSSAPEDFASAIYRNLMAHAAVPRARYFLLVLFPGNFYLWDHARHHEDVTVPDFAGGDETELKRRLRPYMHLQVPVEYRQTRAVADWVNDLVIGSAASGSNQPWLIDSGLLESVRGGAVRTESRPTARVA